MILPDIRKADLKGKRVLLRVDFNVEAEGGKLKEEYKIKSAKETIDFILSFTDVKLALLSHLGRPHQKEEEFSFKNFCGQLENILDINLYFIDDCIGEKVKNAFMVLHDKRALMLENARFYEEEEAGDANFARKLAENFDVYVNESFGVDHRAHASLTTIIEFLPSFAGINLQKEALELSRARNSFEKPAVAIIGGAKIETKLPMIKFFAKNYDYVLIGGKIGLEAQKNKVILPANVILPIDYLADGLDIGPQTIEIFKKHIELAKTIVWNGPLGKFEDLAFAVGTKSIAEAVSFNAGAYKVAGGGETIQFLEQNNLMDKFNFISTGGGAMLEFFIKGTVPVLEALKRSV